MRLPNGFDKHNTERVGQALVVALVLLLGGGTAAALALLPPAVGDPSADGGSAATTGAAASAIAVGRLDARRTAPHRPGRAHYRRTTSRHVAASAQTGFLPLYREAARTFGVPWRLIASIHRQETAFSSEPSTYHGLNAYGCCAGPMQFNVKNGPVSTWELYRQSFRKGDRPRRYPHRTRRHPSVYDDFDAIMAAGALLRDGGAGDTLDGGAWSAAYAYYGHDSFGVDYASQVVGRAQGWELYGFCLNCPPDESLIAALDDAYGVDARRQLRAADKRRKHGKAKERNDGKADKSGEKAHKRKAPRRPSGAEAEPAAPAPAPAPTQTTPAPEPPTTTTTTTTVEAPPQSATPPPADAGSCTRLERLLGCRD